MKPNREYSIVVFCSFLLVFGAIYFGEILHLYGKVIFFDKFFHAAGGVFVAWFFFLYLGKILSKSSKIHTVLILVSVASLVGVLWECMEYFATHYRYYDNSFISQYLYIGSLKDTLSDLLADIVGGFLFSVGYLLRKKK